MQAAYDYNHSQDNNIALYTDHHIKFVNKKVKSLGGYQMRSQLN